MKKNLLLVSALTIFGLTACGGPSTPAAPSVTGNWSGTYSFQGQNIATVSGTFNQTNSPANGDFTANLALTAGGTTSSNVPAQGNANNGTFNISDSSASILCNGAFSNGSSYSGKCAFNYEGQTRTLNLVMNKN